MMSISCGLQIGYTLNFPEEPETAQENIREIGPHVMFAPPRLYEGMTRQVQVKYIDSTWIKRKIYEFCHEGRLQGGRHGIRERNRSPSRSKSSTGFAYWLMQKKLKDHLGMSGSDTRTPEGRPWDRTIFRFFHALGVNLKQIYGQTEIAGISIVHGTAM
jgi:long-chain acyl-CoA synthetase